MSEPDPLTLTAATCAAALVTGFLRNAVGGGIGLTLTPLLTLFLPPPLVLATLGLLLLASDPISLRLYWKRSDHDEARRLLPTMLVGILLGVGLYLVTRPLTNAGIVATGTVLYTVSDVVKVATYGAIGWITPALLLATAASLPMLYLGSWLGIGSTRGCRAARSRSRCSGSRSRAPCACCWASVRTEAARACRATRRRSDERRRGGSKRVRPPIRMIRGEFGSCDRFVIGESTMVQPLRSSVRRRMSRPFSP